MSIFPYPWRPRSVWNPAKKCSGNCWIAANYTWSETNYRQSKPLKGPPNPPKSRRRPKNRLLKANGAVDLTEVTHDRPVSEKLSPPFGSAYEILGLTRRPRPASWCEARVGLKRRAAGPLSGRGPARTMSWLPAQSTSGPSKYETSPWSLASKPLPHSQPVLPQSRQQEAVCPFCLPRA